MFKKINSWVKNQLQKVKNAIAKSYKYFFKFIFVLIILASAWHGFLYLVGKPPIDATPALIMVWLSVFSLIITLFPKLFDRIKRLKLKDFEIELHETVRKSTIEEDFISMDEADDYVFQRKGNFKNLIFIFKQSVINPEKPILLTANLKNGRYISIIMLFIYLFFLDLMGSTVHVLFLSSPRSIKYPTDILQNSLIGIISGKKVMGTFYDKFPHLFKIFELIRGSIRGEHEFKRDFFRSILSEELLHIYYNDLRNNWFHEKELLTEDDIVSWFGRDLSKKFFNLDNIESYHQSIKAAIIDGDEFLIIIKDKAFRSIIAVCQVAKNLSLKIFENI